MQQERLNQEFENNIHGLCCDGPVMDRQLAGDDPVPLDEHLDGEAPKYHIPCD